MDVIGATSFGIEVDSLKNPNNDFVKMAKKIFDFSIFSPFIIISCKYWYFTFNKLHIKATFPKMLKCQKLKKDCLRSIFWQEKSEILLHLDFEAVVVL